MNYVFPTFITRHMPIGLPGLLVAAILAAAMSTIAGELSALSTATVIDFYRRFVRAEASDAHFLRVSRVATGFWGLFASIVAVWAAELGSLIEVVNRFGSFFYGSILGVFILAVGFPRATANGAFIGLVAGMGAVAWAASATNVAFLWHNVIGAVAVVIVGLAVSAVTRAVAAMLRVFVTGGTFDKTYDEIHGRLSFGDTHVPEMLRLGALAGRADGRDADDDRQSRHDRHRSRGHRRAMCRMPGAPASSSRTAPTRWWRRRGRWPGVSATRPSC